MREVWSMIGEAWLGMLTWFGLCVCVDVLVCDYEQLATTPQIMYVCVCTCTHACVFKFIIYMKPFLYVPETERVGLFMQVHT